MSVRSPVVVGVDGSPTDEIAVRLAAGEAQRRRVPLHIVHVVERLTLPISIESGLAERAMNRFADIAEEITSEAAGRARAATPDIEVKTDVRVGQVVPLLLDAVRDARLVVLGSAERFSPEHARLGSVAAHITAHAPCPVIVAREPAAGEPAAGPSAGRIVVGVDGSDISLAAIAFAFEEAAWHGVGLTAVHAWDNPRARWALDRSISDEVERSAARVLAESLAGWSEKNPDVVVEAKLVRAHPVQALLDESAGARLLVVGSHGRGRFGEMVLGSVSQALLRHAATSIAVVRHIDAMRPGDSSAAEWAGRSS